MIVGGQAPFAFRRAGAGAARRRRHHSSSYYSWRPVRASLTIPAANLATVRPNFQHLPYASCLELQNRGALGIPPRTTIGLRPHPGSPWQTHRNASTGLKRLCGQASTVVKVRLVSQLRVGASPAQ
jgi:hypothetical protein